MDFCTDFLKKTNIDLLLRNQDRIIVWGTQIMSYLLKTLPKEAKDVLNQCETDGHAALQLFHLCFHPVHFLFQIDECHVVPIQGNKIFTKYVSDYDWYTVNRALVLSQKGNIDEEHTQDIFTSNMKCCDDIWNIVAIVRHSSHGYIINQYKEGNFPNSIAQIEGNIPTTSGSSGWSNQGRIQTNVQSMVLYGDNDNNNNNDGPAEYDYCRPHTDPNFCLFYLLMFITYSGCDEEKLAYHSCQHEQRIFNNSVIAITNN